MPSFNARLAALTEEHGPSSIIFMGGRCTGVPGMIAVIKTKKGHHKLICNFPGHKNVSQGVATDFVETSMGFELTAEIGSETFMLRANRNHNHISTLAGVKFRTFATE